MAAPDPGSPSSGAADWDAAGLSADPGIFRVSAAGGPDYLFWRKPLPAQLRPGETVQFTLSSCHCYDHSQPFQVYQLSD